MLKVQTPFFFLPTREVRETFEDLGQDLSAAARAAFHEVSMAAKGLEIAHLQFEFGGVTLAICSRVRRDGKVEIEAGMGDASLPRSLFTARQMQAAEQAARVRDALHRRQHRERSR